MGITWCVLDMCMAGHAFEINGRHIFTPLGNQHCNIIDRTGQNARCRLYPKKSKGQKPDVTGHTQPSHPSTVKLQR